MKYYVTIYIDKLFEKELFNLDDFTHAFLGLTKDKTPNELDKIDKESRDKKLKNRDWKDIDKKWYESLESNDFNDGFWGFGTASGDLGKIGKAAGKVFANNQYIVSPNKDTNQYDNAKLRSKQTFSPSNRCTLEISQEQYEFLLGNIKKDFNTTKDIKPQSLEPINDDFSYYLYGNNCVVWVIKKLFDIGIEIPNQRTKDPYGLSLCFESMSRIHSTFLKFQNIDDNLKSIKGAKAFRNWARMLIDNCYIQKEYFDNHKHVKNRELSEDEKEILLTLFNISSVYTILDEILQSRLDKIVHTDTKGDFELIYYDQQEKQIKSLKAGNNYNPIAVENFDLNIPANNCSLNKFYPFIFIPKDKTISRILYHQYDYGEVSNSYQIAMNEFYKNILAGIQSDKYWSKSYHKMNKKLEKLNV